MSLHNLLVENIDELIHKINLEKLKLLLELQLVDEYESKRCAEDIYYDIKKRGIGIFIYNVENSLSLELFVYNGRIILLESNILKINEKEDIKSIIGSLNNPCRITIYKVVLPTRRYVNEFVFSVKVMDQNHIEMFGIIDDLILSIIRGDLKSIKKFADKLYDHTKNKHFKIEEELMIETKYDKYFEKDYRIHINWHRDFLEVLKEVKDNAEKEEYVELIENLLMIFETYFDKYLKDIDAKLAQYLKRVLNQQQLSSGEHNSIIY